jgi:hypothetical protein
MRRDSGNKTGVRTSTSQSLLIRAVLPILIGVLALSSRYNSSGQDLPALTPLVEQWLRGQDRNDFPWKVRLLAPRLTFQQRHLAEVTAIVRAEDLDKGEHERELLFTLAVGDEQGHWIKQANATTLELPAIFPGKQDIIFSEAIYVRPGSYLIAVMANDSTFGKVNVWRSPLLVPPLSGDPLPEMEMHLPRVEFASDIPKNAPEILQGIGGIWPMAQEPARLPVENKRPVSIDLVLNVAGDFRATFGTGRRGVPAVSPRPSLFNAVLEVGNLLSQLDLKSGCVRTSVVDIRRMQVIVDRQDPSMLDWGQLQEPLWKAGSHTIDVGSLQNRNQQSVFLHDLLERIMSGSGPCSARSDNTEHILALVSQDLSFPAGTILKKLDPDKNKGCRFYFFQLDPAMPSLGDTVYGMLKPLQPRRLRFDSPQTLRQAVARFLAYVLE